jgi:hypothetical protein
MKGGGLKIGKFKGKAKAARKAAEEAAKEKAKSVATSELEGEANSFWSSDTAKDLESEENTTPEKPWYKFFGN